MNFTEDNPKQTKKPNGTAALLALVLTAVFLGWVNIYLTGSGNSMESILKFVQKKDTGQVRESREFLFEQNSKPVFGMYGSSIVFCTREMVKALGADGEELWNYSLALQNSPLVRTAGKYLLIAAEGGNDFYILENGKLKWSKKIDNKIINAAIGANGTAVILKEDTGYRGEALVYDSAGNELFTRLFAQDFLVNAAVSHDGKLIVVGSLDASGVRANTNLTFIHARGEVKDVVNRQDTLLPKIMFLQSDVLAAFSGSGILVYDKDCRLMWEKNFDEGQVLSVEMGTGKYIAAAALKAGRSTLLEGNKSSIRLFDLLGQPISEAIMDGEVKGLAGSEDMLAVSTGREITFLNLKGKEIYKYSSNKEIKQVLLMQDGNSAFLVTADSLLQIRMK